VLFRDAYVHEIEAFSVPWSEGLGSSRGSKRGELPAPGVTARPGRSFRLFCPGGQPYRGAIAASGEIASSTGINETVRIRRSPDDPSVFTYQLPASLQALATPGGCRSLYRALDRILESTPTLVLRELCALLRRQIPNLRSQAVLKVFCTAAEAILGFAQMGDDSGITPVCRQALAREVPGMQVAILTDDGWVDRWLPIEWTDPNQADGLEIGEASGDRVRWSGPSLRFGYFDLQADIQSWCVDRGETEFHLEAFPLHPGGGWGVDPIQRVFDHASPSGRTRLVASELVPCNVYLVEITRKDPGGSVTLAMKVVAPDLTGVERIHWDPTGAGLGAQRFSNESQCEVWRSDRAGAPHYMTLAACDENGRTDLTRVGWHSIRFLNGILPEITEVEFTCDGGPGFRFTVGGRQAGVGIRSGRKVGYAAIGIVTFQVTRSDTHDDVALSYHCQDDANCDLAVDVSLSFVVPRDQARWGVYPR
jgi:hypothetical protein